MSLNEEAEQWSPGVYSEAFPPGTVPLEKLFDKKHGEIILHPRPTADPNDPLNWPKWYKTWNFALVSFYALMVFVNVDIGTVVWGAQIVDLGYTVQDLTWSFGFNTAGLAVGCIVFIPFALKFGRRIIYLFSTSVGVATAIWQAKMVTTGDLWGSNILAGLAGSIAETICQMTIADLFFVHQRGTANGVYIVMVNIGAFLGPVAAGYSADSQGWRWIFWWTTIFFAICLILFVLAYEDTKYVPSQQGTAPLTVQTVVNTSKDDVPIEQRKLSFAENDHERLDRLDSSIPRKGYFERLTLLDTSPGGWKKFLRHAYQPFQIMFIFPAVAYTALIYGSLLAWFSVVVSSYSVYFTLPPYNFSSAGIGLLNLGPFIGSVFGSIYGGILNDWLIIRLSRRNKGVYEPEMRLWSALPAVILLPGSLLMIGLTMARGMPWIIPAVGTGIYGFTFATLGDISLTYAMDCYQEVVGDALVAVCFVRNAFATIIAMTLTDWINGVGLDAVFATSAALSFVLSATTVPMLIWGKKARIEVWRRGWFDEMTKRQFGPRQ